ncbi:MAG TPA: YbaB/EbfC family nucleoid-associated protein [Nonomuraea sp.]|nr:YbaB/EbfC family nucleoid-associated protein [Nonomuraea sp.]
MQEFGDFANIDIDRLLKDAERQMGLLEEFQRDIGSYVGRAEDEHGLVTVEYDHQGVRELELHPKAMRLASGELAELIKAVLKDATADFEARISQAMGELFGERGNPMKNLGHPDAALGRMKEMEVAYDQAFGDVMGQLDRIRRNLEL